MAKRSESKKTRRKSQSKTNFITLKSRTNQEGNNLLLPDPKVLNEHFASIGALLSAKIYEQNENDHFQDDDRTMFLYPTDQTEVGKIIKQMKNKNVLIMMESPTKF